ncbi:stage V sporulation protein AA [Halobacillus andaensis]|uniref:Stage V sporulation protein AA n=1 Tax=Halobacillus andaensis TaxID=1176239 RepID=A0A917ETE5_HALAA|nr:stage V sporulation protein AA [Halobacillus andaensis]MBP2003209.1 stage V sporulation protein AA [Halobacillus andaensis]GGF08872.1 stage V sporulation protein AA [Halobacillus andaensis]
MTTPIYVRMKQSIRIPVKKEIRLYDVAKVTGTLLKKQTIENMILHRIKAEDKNIIVIDSYSIVDQIVSRFPEREVEILGPNQCVVHIERKKKKPPFFVVLFIWLLLFIGAAMAIMNFHYDVAMESVQQKLHYMLTGEEEKHPLWIQVPYSLGLGIGMILFFNHWFSKKFNEEPNPMEVEVFKYQEDLDHYVAIHENKVEQKDEDR